MHNDRDRLLILGALFLMVLPHAGRCQLMVDLKPKDGNTVGYISHDPTLDDPDFRLCGGTIQQYYAVDGGYRGGRKRLLELLAQQPKLQSAGEAEQTGYLTIRFVVNCKGQTDRFRILQVDKRYAPTTFDTVLVSNLLSFTKQLTDWLPGEYDGNYYDYFQYLTFKLADGKVVDILP